MTKRLEGKVALITGGTTGIGRATAHEFAAQGATVFIIGRRQAELEEAVALAGPGTIGIRGDISKMEDLDRIYESIAEKAGHLDIVFANAGGGDFLPMGAITEEQFDRIFGINVKGMLFTVQKALPLLRTGASVILTGSTAASGGTENFSVYAASKAAVRSFARNWILDLKPRGIRVNTLSPGPVETPGLTGLVPTEHTQGFLDGFADMVPLGRVGQPSEIAKAALFLASDDSSFVNGIELFADGGLAQI
ncbi:SDR family oxidoreductase [Microbulbifer thermotolerans]|uniref:SDR family NAD(P)-dependent oxidoreductase n=1 Tax=Microbulbifer thermotolerans TaxID=252514 RepID=UPI0022491D1A|nr:SDR family oxidoreductase [Microbulbifer thermotolerans]MCX2781233.1 SDR family oxidoreductase [Microbulbifer thermotolerans]MCX2783425.1 SDR family oxidoreductase [Microbulbifer thermotolerans]MCX2793460.1 SDR family oxidoreductase [Microbulbifer thermotolerans]MCX2803738.1 SDR family oxidoreductase [Microbulbifer thermotolerans]MCX2834945.1 SDR family oxidoreductase [Microbulbifer thermotolerans]